MIPSLVVDDIRTSLIEYLASTFALSDDDVRDALSEFLTDQADGIFRGPYLRVRTPFAEADADWQSPLDWLPDWFVPYAHQAKAFERLGSRDSPPQPTLVTTGTGSGKTECFLMPILDHCARARARGEVGVKALILYPMNALASDQAGRIAELIHSESALAGVTAGLYVGEDGRHTTMGPDHLIDTRHALRADPPDILLTNYKMLDFLLLREEDRDLWAANGPDTLRYVVLDEFHTYDGAQGTDVAMLLRRLGATLAMAGPDGPLGGVAPVATSATLASGTGGTDALRSFAGKVFGVDFDADSVVGEHRTSVDEACGPIDFYLTIPSVPDVLEADELDAVAAAFCTSDDPDAAEPEPRVDDVVDLGRRLLAHPLSRAVLAAVGERPRTWRDAVAEIVARVPDWGRVSMTDPDAVAQALARYLWLLSVARRRQGERLRPLFGIEVQLWVREVSRLLRVVAPEPAFRWHDAGVADTDPDDGDGARTAPELALPGAYCRRCGMSGWIALAAPLGGAFTTAPSQIYQAVAARAPTVRTLIRTGVHDPAAVWFDPVDRRLAAAPHDGAVAVLVTADDDAAKANRCPACDERDAIRFVGLRVASLTSVSVNTLFSSPHLDGDERKLLAFTDSVQDASHRASFLSGRTHRINLRSLMTDVITAAGTVSLADLGDELAAGATNPDARFQLVPPDLLRHPVVRTVWSDEAIDDGLDLLRSRLGFEADIEFGLRSRVGRTLELSHVAAAEVAVGEEALALAAEDITTLLGEVPAQADEHLETWVRGMLERLRLRGAIVHPLLGPYIANAGKLWFVWGGRPDGLPPFTPDQGRPIFATTNSSSADLDSLATVGANPTWWIDWTTKVLGVEPRVARDLNARLFPLLAGGTDLVVRANAGASAVFGLDRRAVVVHDLADGSAPGGVRCGDCGHRHAVPQDRVERVAGTHCMRYRCGGRYVVDPPRPTNYYRRLYRSGITRRVVTGEHTGLLRRHEREQLEAAFKDGDAPDAPNVLTATPTLEMGIDIGDLSAVMLTSVPRNPASYVQRVGRAGRASGNALITTFVPTDSHGLYYLAEPEAMIAGDIRPPDCYLDAVDTLARQYIAYLFDRVADHTIAAPPLPRRIADLFRTGLDEGGLLRALIDASELDAGLRSGFLALFDGHLQPATVDAITELAAVGVETRLKAAAERFGAEEKDLRQRIQRLTGAIERAEPGADDEVAALRGQRAIIVRTLESKREEYTITALERLGVLPNYTLLDNGATLEAAMWSRTPDGGFDTEIVEYSRPGGLAIREFAPGNSFYAGGHRHVVDAIDIGTIDEPVHQQWRLCPECGYGRPETDEAIGHCPRCGAIGFADVSAHHTMVRLTTAYAAGSEEGARVYDESDDRRRERYVVARTVDVDTAHVDHAWRHTERIFGAELARHATLRTINCGFAERKGEQRPIAGREYHITRFTACAHCGTVREARAQADDKPERLHRGWCKVRSGAAAQKWTPLVLFHELVTDAIRILLPVSMFEVDERLASFKGALLLGLREDFGGDPDHLRIVTADLPNRAGMGRRNFLVLYDAVPGGTGYLDRLADPDRMRTILESARRVISRCRCRAEGRSACHRCLLGVVDRNEYDLVHRDLALTLLDSLLEDWDAERVSSVADIDIGLVEESELERRFKVALNDWAARPEAAGWLGVDDVALKPLPGKGGYDAYELRITRDSRVLRYRIDEQEGLSTTPNTRPDFLIRRLDDKAPDMAVYLDGFQFHASAEHNNLADDVAKRNGVRRSGRLVWNLTWNDVETFHAAVTKEYFTGVPKLPLLSGAAKTAAKTQHAQLAAALDFDTVDANPVELLLRRLAEPDAGTWTALALSACAGAASAGDRTLVDADGLHRALTAALAGTRVAVTAVAEPAAVLATTATPQGQSVVLALRTDDPSAAHWTVVAALADDAASVDNDAHRRRWQDWLQWANLLQFLTGTGRDAVITTTSAGPTVDLATLWIGSLFDRTGSTDPGAAAPGVAGGTGAEARPLSQAMLDELDLLIDDAVRSLVEDALAAGAADFVAGHELDGVPLEAAWPGHHVAVVPDDTDIGAADGWTLHRAGETSLADLLADLRADPDHADPDHADPDNADPDNADLDNAGETP